MAVRHAGRSHAILRILALVGFSLALLLTGCTGSSPPASAQTSALHIPLYGDISHPDPGIFDGAQASASTPLFLTSLLNAGLVKFGPDLHVIPEIAVSIPTISTDGRTYTFTIRQDAEFADGEPCTASDVAYSLARALMPGEHSPLASSYLGGIEGASAVEHGQARTLSGVRVLNRLTVRIRLTTPDATFLEKLAFPVAAIVSRHGAGAMGPFALIDQAKNGVMILGPRPGFYGDPLQIDTVHLVPVHSASAGLELYRKGALDVAWIPPDRIPSFSQHADVHQSNSLDAYYAVAPAPLAGQLAASVDRDTLIKSELPALSALDSIVPPSVPDYVSSPPSLTVTGGQIVPGKSTLSIRVAQPADKLGQHLGRALSNQWRHAGGSGTVWIVHQIHMLPDPGRWLSMVSSMAPPWYATALAQANGLTNDPVSRMNTYSDEEQWALRKGLVIPLAAGATSYLIKPAVQGVDVTPAGLMPQNDNWSAVSITE